MKKGRNESKQNKTINNPSSHVTRHDLALNAVVAFDCAELIARRKNGFRLKPSLAERACDAELCDDKTERVAVFREAVEETSTMVSLKTNSVSHVDMDGITARYWSVPRLQRAWCRIRMGSKRGLGNGSEKVRERKRERKGGMVTF